MNTLMTPLNEMAEYDEAKREILKSKGLVEINGCVDSAKLHLIYGLSSEYTNTLIVTYNELRAKEICEDYSFYNPNVVFYKARDLMFYQADVHGNHLTKLRINCICPLIKDEPVTVVTTFDALMEHVVTRDVLESHVFEMTVGDDINLKGLEKDLITLGYTRNYQVEEAGQFSVRGGIIDIYPLNEDNPIRIELFGDEVDSIRSFDVLTQRSLETLESVMIFPASEIVLTPGQIEDGIEKIKKDAEEYSSKLRKEFKTEEAHRVKTLSEELLENLKYFGVKGSNIENSLGYFCDSTVSFLDYFDCDDTLLVVDEPARVKEKGETVELEFRESMEQRLLKGYILPKQAEVIYRSTEIFSGLDKFHGVALASLPVGKTVYKPANRHSVISTAMNSYNNSFEELKKDLLKYKKNGYRVLLVCASRTRGMRLRDDLLDELSVFYSEECNHPVNPGEVMITYGRIKQGFNYPLIKYVVISESDIFTTERKKKKKKQHKEGAVIHDFSELSVGDYVVHESHGLGIYKGIEQVCVEHVTKDYMMIEYGDGGKLYIPATALDSIQKYSSGKGSAPKLNKLGTGEWNKTKSKVKSAVDEIASDLVELYANRRDKAGFCYSEDTVWQTEFEERFPFEETEDQLSAIEATKRDMESSKIMDRLICGDVGYGKTEIAIRAAFKAIQDGKQVAYLVPTTILAQQHYNTFVQRMKDYPVRVDNLSRFVTPTQQKKTIADLKKGLVDVVIGTHRILSKDVEFKDLGLLIIDEEQRFGVRHKESIKKIRENVDVLTLTATPIPRTLHMSLIGIRDMSVLEEAPQDRMPIQTFVCEYNEELVREAINRELARGGQVFYVYNRVNTIMDMTAFLQNLVPEANVAFAHGQMKEHELENIMLDFVNGEIDVLVSTTIIETGLDISNVNTMIIHDSDKMGLSQLYQLRGRVGRSNRTAYAFLMYKKDKLLKEVAEKRLQAIRDFTELGSGFKIAMKDLEIRGAGNLLGEKQSGHMAAVGYDLYCKMLNEAVKQKKGIDTVEDCSVSVDINVDAYIPDSYIVNENQKIDIYKRIAAIESDQERSEMQDELVDRFGNLPRSVVNLLDIAYIRMLARTVFVVDIKEENRSLKLSVYEKAVYDNSKIPAFIQSFRGALQLRAGAKPYFLYVYPKGTVYVNEALINLILNLLKEMQDLLVI